MGSLESDAKRKRSYRYLQNSVLAAVGVAGVLAVAMIAPNVFQAFPRLMGNKARFGYRTHTAAGRLAAKGLVRFRNRNGQKYLEITEAGKRTLELETQREAMRKPRKRRWDKRYRMVIFDIPERRRKVRVRLRTMMQEIGFLRLQDSVWVFPYDCEDIVSLLKAELRIGKDVLYTIVEQIENDNWIKKHFNLS